MRVMENLNQQTRESSPGARPHFSGAFSAAHSVEAIQICNGLGAGNIGDELAARAFWHCLPPTLKLRVPLFAESAFQHQPYPQEHEYIAVDFAGNETAAPTTPGLVVGSTCVAENEGLDWPLRFFAPRLAEFHRRSLPMDAIGVGVDLLKSPEALALFTEYFLPIRSWTVRSRFCRDALLAMGVNSSQIRIGADFAWLYKRTFEHKAWASELWTRLGIRLDAPLIVMNPVNLVWQHLVAMKQEIAAGLDGAARRFGLQVAFFCNEFRPGEAFDESAAREIQSLMKEPSVLVPAEYYSPDEVLALLEFAAVTVSQRYHFTIESIMAGAVPISIVRGQKMAGLVSELGLPSSGTIDAVDRGHLVRTIESVLNHRSGWCSNLSASWVMMRQRAEANFAFLSQYHPYSRLRVGWDCFKKPAASVVPL
jgi:polysaccharide pyruvyl transferase WcaK-like protein